MTYKILFRADAEPGLGTGDLVALSYLSKTFLRNGFDTCFMVRDHPTARKTVTQRNLENVFWIPAEKTVEEEVDAINEVIRDKNFTHFFCAVTRWNLSPYSLLDPKPKKGCINGDGVVPSDWDLIVNWNIKGTADYPRDRYPKARFLIGPEYVILPDTFDREAIKARRYASPIKNVLITMGGADKIDIVSDVVQQIVQENLDLHLTVVLGPGYTFIERLQQTLLTTSLDYEIKTGLTDLFPEYLACDAAIGTGGLTCTELMATHTRALLIAVAKHQIARCQFYHDKGMAQYLGFQQEFKKNSLREKFAQIDALQPERFKMKFEGAEAIFKAFSQMS